MSKLRGLICLGAGTTATILGMDGGDPGAVQSAVDAAIDWAGVSDTLLTAVGGGMLGTVSHNALAESYNTIAQRLIAGAQKGKLPANHDLLKALRRSQLDALGFLVETYAERAKSDPQFDKAVAKQFCKAARTFLKSEYTLCDKGTILTPEDLGLAPDPGGQSVLGVQDSEASKVVERLWQEGTRATLAELERGIAPEVVPDAFRDWYNNEFGPFGFALLAQQYFAERLKTEERVRTAFFVGEFQALKANSATIIATLSRIDASLTGLAANLSQRFDVLEQRLAALPAGRDPDMSQTVLNAMLAATGSVQFKQFFDGLMSAYLPHDEWRGSIVAKDVQDRIDSLLWREVDGPLGKVQMPAFFGREAQLDELDNAVGAADRGLIVLCAASGSGKSALLAKWCERRTNSGDLVVRHFVSIKYPTTTSPSACLQHLLVQLRLIDRNETDNREAAIPVDERELLSAIHERLQRPAPQGRRVIVVIDALDELEAPFVDTFVRSDLGEGNWIVISRRVDPNLLKDANGIWPPPVARWPIEMQKWLAASPGQDRKPIAWRLPALSDADVQDWLEEFIGADIAPDKLEQMAIKLQKVTDGLPLFLKYLIADLIESPLTADERVRRIAQLETPFSGFLKQFISGQLDDVTTNRNKAMSVAERSLLAVLAQMKGVISMAELQALYELHAAKGPQVGTLDVAQLDRRLQRWLAVLPAPADEPDQSQRLIFDHPRLASEFAHVLDDQVEDTRQSILEYVTEKWRPAKRKFGGEEARGATYALRHAPAHLFDIGENSMATAMMMDQSFYRERFLSFDAAEAVDMMVNDWNRWQRSR